MPSTNQYLGFLKDLDSDAFTILSGGALQKYDTRFRERVDLATSFRVLFPNAVASNAAAASLRKQLEPHQVKSTFQKLGHASAAQLHYRDPLWFDAAQLDAAYKSLKVIAGEKGLTELSREPIQVAKNAIKKASPKKAAAKMDEAYRKAEAKFVAQLARDDKRYADKLWRHTEHNIRSAENISPLLAAALSSGELLGLFEGYLVFDSSKASAKQWAAIQIWNTHFKTPDRASPIRPLDPFCRLGNFWFTRCPYQPGNPRDCSWLNLPELWDTVIAALASVPDIDRAELPGALLTRMASHLSVDDFRQFPPAYKNYSWQIDHAARVTALLEALTLDRHCFT